MCSESHSALTCLDTCLLTRGIPLAQRLRALSNPPIWKDSRFLSQVLAVTNIFSVQGSIETAILLAAELDLLNKEKGCVLQLWHPRLLPFPLPPLPATKELPACRLKGLPGLFQDCSQTFPQGQEGSRGGTIAKFRKVWTEES